MSSFLLCVPPKPCFAQLTVFLRSSTARAFAIPKRNVTSTAHFSTRTATLRRTQSSLPWLLTATGIAGASLGISSLTTLSALHCDDILPSRATPSLPPPPKSSVNAYELTFGTVCGICAGVFVKKSARMVAFFIGGLFVILQYLGSVSVVKVDWARMASQFENLFYTTDTSGNKKPPTVRSIWRWVIDFLTADFQPRASFVVGFALGLRAG